MHLNTKNAILRAIDRACECLTDGEVISLTVKPDPTCKEVFEATITLQPPPVVFYGSASVLEDFRDS